MQTNGSNGIVKLIKEKKLKEKRFLLTVNQRVVGSSPTGGAWLSISYKSRSSGF